MLVYGAMISAVSLLFLAVPWSWVSADIARAHYLMSILCMIALSVGEVVWSPKLYEYTAAIAPEGQEGTYLGISMVPWFLAKTLVSVISGHLLVRWCPEGIGAAHGRRPGRLLETARPPCGCILSLVGLVGCFGAVALRRLADPRAEGGARPERARPERAQLRPPAPAAAAARAPP